MKLNKVQERILEAGDCKENAYLLAFFRNDLVVKDSIDFRTVDALFEWAIEQTPVKIGLFATVGILRTFYDFRSISPQWEPLRDVLDAHLEAIDHKDKNRIMCGMRGSYESNEFRIN